LCGLPAFVSVLLSAPLQSALLFRSGAFLIGLGGGLFTVCTLTIAMQDAAEDPNPRSGLALGAWGAVQATAGGLGIAVSGFIRDGVSSLATAGKLGTALAGPVTGYAFVYLLEIVLIFASLAAIGPLVRRMDVRHEHRGGNFGLAEMPA
jgi:MFS transporter, BCD family, chlorophyll transporter